jgi:hypothetical protein
MRNRVPKEDCFSIDFENRRIKGYVVLLSKAKTTSFPLCCPERTESGRSRGKTKTPYCSSKTKTISFNIVVHEGNVPA